MNERRYKYYSLSRPDAAIALSLLITAFLFGLGYYWLSAVGVGAFVFYFTRLVLETGEDITIENLIMTIASLQWIIGPFLSYSIGIDHYKYHMYVPEEAYMSLAVPSVILFSVGLYLFRPRKRAVVLHNLGILTSSIVNKNTKLPYYLIGVGFLFSFAMPYIPISLLFVFYILSNLKYIGIIYILFSDRYKNKMAILAVAFMLTFLSSLNSAMFHDLILWFVFIGMYYAFLTKPTVGKKVAIMIMVFVGIFILQSAKHVYRDTLAETGRENTVGKFIDSVGESLSEDRENEGNNVEKVVNRINQGWIISRIMQVVPDRVPHAEGGTVITAVKASVLPRLLFPDKPIAGGRENYEKYTGYELTRSTSMGISLLGESYINYGLTGAWVFMLLIGIMFSYMISLLFKLVGKYPTFWLWMPLILLHFVKAETELLVQLNYLVKSAILIVAFLFVNKAFLKIRL